MISYVKLKNSWLFSKRKPKSKSVNLNHYTTPLSQPLQLRLNVSRSCAPKFRNSRVSHYYNSNTSQSLKRLEPRKPLNKNELLKLLNSKRKLNYAIPSKHWRRAPTRPHNDTPTGKVLA